MSSKLQVLSLKEVSLALCCSCSIFLFADDSKLYADVQSEGDAQKLQADLNVFTDWPDKWQLTFNVDKCKVLHISKKNSNYVYSMRCGDYVSEIESVQKEKDLLIRFDNKLRFSDQY